jgi:hypothetical protein
MTPAAFRKLALSMPGAVEMPHFERNSFRVGKKIFATQTADGRQAMVKVKPIDRVEALLARFPDTFFDHGAWTWKMGALGVNLARADAVMMRELVKEAWADVARR